MENGVENPNHFLFRATVIVPWGSEGAGARVGQRGLIVQCPSHPPPVVRDTLGAGDAFIAATIFALSAGACTATSIDLGCRVAGLKVGLKGWAELKEALPKAHFARDFLKLREGN